MKGTIRKTGLLEYIAERAGCAYLSDLHNKKRNVYLSEVIAEISPSEYALREWEDAVRYIAETEISFVDSDQAAEYLLEQLKK